MAAAAPLIRACPECGTRFRVAPELLDVAVGQVRCGVCLTVFDGRVEAAPQAPVDAAASMPPGIATMPAWPDPVDEAPAPPSAEREPEAARAEPAASARAPFPSTAERPPTEPASAPVAPVSAGRDAPAPAPSVRMGARAALAAKALERAAPKREKREKARERRRLAAADAPAEAANERKPLLVCAIVGAALALGVNIFGLRADAWSQLPQTRGLYQAACAVIGCEVASPKALAAWHVDTKSETRPGPPEPIVVEVALVNNAPYRQRLPTVLARLADEAGEQRAEQRLTPRDYAPDRSAQRLAPGKPKVVRLRFADPGAAATRYTITLL